jgi:hypothetical protein
MKIFQKIFFTIFISAIFAIEAGAKPTIAFGYIYNIRNERELNYLEFILPNSFANSVSAVFDVNIKKPLDLENELSKSSKSLKKDYEFYELPELISDVRSDILIFGNFKSAPDNQIKIELNIYMKDQGEIFSFTNYGRMETQVSKIVDRISIIIINFMSDHNLYKVRKIMPGTKLAILTNLEGEEQNSLLIPFMEKGYPLVCFQNNEIHTAVKSPMIDKFSYIRTMKNSYDTVTDWRKTEFYYSTWTDERYNNRIKYLKDLYNKYDINYDVLKNDVLDKINDAYKKTIDVLIIIGFSDNRRTSWVRAIDIKGKELIWMQSNIKSDLLSLDPIASNVDKIVEGMIAEPLNPFIKLDESADKK